MPRSRRPHENTSASLSSVIVGEAAQFQKWLPLVWTGLAAAILTVDYSAGPLISTPVLFVVPVILAAWLSGRRWAAGLGVAVPLIHLSFAFLWQGPWRPLGDAFVNASISISVLVAFAVLIDRVARQAREIRVLRGLLPVCCVCKKIRTEGRDWIPMEIYISERSEATFTHTFCPECAKQQFPEIFGRVPSGR